MVYKDMLKLLKSDIEEKIVNHLIIPSLSTAIYFSGTRAQVNNRVPRQESAARETMGCRFLRIDKPIKPFSEKRVRRTSHGKSALRSQLFLFPREICNYNGRRWSLSRVCVFASATATLAAQG